MRNTFHACSSDVAVWSFDDGLSGLVHVPFPTFSVVAQVLNHFVHILWAAA
jgi:hypothetical protein